MDWFNENDIELSRAVESLKEDMATILAIADECDADSKSEYYTENLRTCINRFLEDC